MLFNDEKAFAGFEGFQKNAEKDDLYFGGGVHLVDGAIEALQKANGDKDEAHQLLFGSWPDATEEQIERALDIAEQKRLLGYNRKTAVENIFNLYETVDGWEDAQQAILDAIGEGKPFNEVMEIAKKYKKFGATDTASEDEIWEYMQKHAIVRKAEVDQQLDEDTEGMSVEKLRENKEKIIQRYMHDYGTYDSEGNRVPFSRGKVVKMFTDLLKSRSVEEEGSNQGQDTKSFGKGWEQGPRGGQRRRGPDGKWIYKGSSLQVAYMKFADKIPGGLAEGKPDSEFDSKNLQKGTEEEMEHTTDKDVAKEIAKDHLIEDPDYYEKLEKMMMSELSTEAIEGFQKDAKSPEGWEGTVKAMPGKIKNPHALAWWMKNRGMKSHK